MTPEDKILQNIAPDWIIRFLIEELKDLRKKESQATANDRKNIADVYFQGRKDEASILLHAVRGIKEAVNNPDLSKAKYELMKAGDKSINPDLS